MKKLFVPSPSITLVIGVFQAILEDNAPKEQKGKPPSCAREQDNMQQQGKLEMQQGPKHQWLQMERQPSSDSAEEGFQASMSALMYLLSNHDDKHAAVAAALNAVLNVPRRQACQDPTLLYPQSSRSMLTSYEAQTATKPLTPGA